MKRCDFCKSELKGEVKLGSCCNVCYPKIKFVETEYFTFQKVGDVVRIITSYEDNEISEVVDLEKIKQVIE
jgi:hypothetical protein